MSIRIRIVKASLTLLLIAVIISPTIARTATTPASQTIPPIITSSLTSTPGCSQLTVYPGGAIADSSGFIIATCPNNHPAMLILAGTETPTFTLTVGLSQFVLMYYNIPCSFNFIQYNRLVGMNLTSATPLSFTPATNSTTQLLIGAYNYCLYYTLPPTAGIQSFTIVWSP